MRMTYLSCYPYSCIGSHYRRGLFWPSTVFKGKYDGATDASLATLIDEILFRFRVNIRMEGVGGREQWSKNTHE